MTIEPPFQGQQAKGDLVDLNAYGPASEDPHALGRTTGDERYAAFLEGVSSRLGNGSLPYRFQEGSAHKQHEHSNWFTFYVSHFTFQLFFWSSLSCMRLFGMSRVQ